MPRSECVLSSNLWAGSPLTNAFVQVGKVLGSLYKQGWRPRRSIVLASWDGEEFNLVGSTEWVEQNLPLLSTQAVAYLNIDTAVAGPGFHAAATPQLDDVIRHAAGLVRTTLWHKSELGVPACRNTTAYRGATAYSDTTEYRSTTAYSWKPLPRYSWPCMLPATFRSRTQTGRPARQCWTRGRGR